MEQRRGGDSGTGRRIRLWLGGAVLVLMIVLILQNQEPVDIQILFWESKNPLFLLLSAVGVLGLVAGYVLGRQGRPD